MKCRHCAAPLKLTFVDLGSAPPSNAYLTEAALKASERWFPLRVLVCESCWLVQTDDYADARELFDATYAYFSGVSVSWLEHCRHYAEAMIDRFGLDGDSHVVEVAANDGSLLQYFQARGVRSTGIEPTASTAASARAKGIPVVEEFFGTALAEQLSGAGQQADLMAANNVLAHVPDINDFVKGFAILLKPDGIVTFEFPHLLRLVMQRQFDTIYHEHFSYLSLTAIRTVMADAGLQIFDVEELPTHGGSLRVYGQRADTAARAIAANVEGVLNEEKAAGVATAAFYTQFQRAAETVKNDFLDFLLKARREGARVAAYGAAAKGNTLLNYAGIKGDLLPFVVDRSPSKQGKYLPGSRIPVVVEDELKLVKPEYVVILPWNIREEVMQQLAYIRAWGGSFVVAVPRLEIIRA